MDDGNHRIDDSDDMSANWDDSPSPTWWDRIKSFVGGTVGCLITDGVCLWFAYLGARGISEGRLRHRYGRMSYGDQAVSESWVLLGLSIFLAAR